MRTHTQVWRSYGEMPRKGITGIPLFCFSIPEVCERVCVSVIPEVCERRRACVSVHVCLSCACAVHG